MFLEALGPEIDENLRFCHVSLNNVYVEGSSISLLEQVSGPTDPESVDGASSLPGACSLPASSSQKSMKT